MEGEVEERFYRGRKKRKREGGNSGEAWSEGQGAREEGREEGSSGGESMTSWN